MMDHWIDVKAADIADTLREHVASLRSDQSQFTDRFQRIDRLYDPYGPNGRESVDEGTRISENILATAVDTISAVIAGRLVRVRVLTDDGDWSQQRKARAQELYAWELDKVYDIQATTLRAFREMAKKGLGVTKSWEWGGRLQIRHVLPERLIAHPGECIGGGKPRELHEICVLPMDEAAAMYPKAADEIARAEPIDRVRQFSYDHNFHTPTTTVEAIHSVRLPTLAPGMKGYKPGRYVLIVAGAVLVDREWTHDHFPWAYQGWTPREDSFYPIGGAERIVGIQNALNRRNRQIEIGIDRAINPFMAVRPADAGFMQASNRVGPNAYVFRADMPVAITMPALAAEVYASREDYRQQGLAEFGISGLAARGSMPAGLVTAPAQREYHDRTMARWAPQEIAHESLIIDTILRAFCVCKELGSAAPAFNRRGRFGMKRLEWADVDLQGVRAQMQIASSMPRLTAGRMSQALEFFQAQVITPEQFMRLVPGLDVQREISLGVAALERIEEELDAIADGYAPVPDAMSDLAMSLERGTAEYNSWIAQDGVPEDRLDTLRDYLSFAEHMITSAAKPPEAVAPDPMAALGAPGAPAAPDPMASAPLALPTAP